jgi:class 3 adenylate cyclase/tetratricopeptide (TPR) repeat protein
LQVQIDKLRASINGLEAQRGVLGDAIVDPALAALRQQLALLEEQAATLAKPAEERRMVTILFADMVGSTALAEKLDPEEWRQVVEKIHTTLGKVVVAHHGIIGQYLGDGLLAFFGAKASSENDPENAIRAALYGQAAVEALPLPEKVQLRVGIHSGLVVVGDLGEAEHKEFTASGDAMNLAARLQAAAPPGGILISQDTYRYVRGVFNVTPRPLITVKGKSEPIKTFLVRGTKPRPFRTVTRGVAGVETRTIGREPEMNALQAAYLRAYEQHGVAWAQLVSDPGLGKSRLMDDMNDWLELREERYRILRARAFPDDTNQPFALIRRMWFDRFQIAEDMPLDQAEKKWVERFKEFSGQENNEEAAHALGLLAGLPFQNSPYIGAMRKDPTQVKGRSTVVSRDLLKAVRREAPIVVMLEDLQWADTASWEYLMEVFLGEAAGEQPNGMFILGAARPEWRPPEALLRVFESSLSTQYTSDSWGIQISLTLLPEGATRELARELLQRVQDVPEGLLELIVERSEGVPYFAEEIVNWMIDHRILETHEEQWRFLPDKLKEQPLPATLQHLLLTRLSSLSQPERIALQRGAIFGRRFWTGGVEALGVSGGAEMLGHLQPRGFVEAQSESAFAGDTEWSFHHNLLQEVTYESVLKRERADLHREAAAWLERQARLAGRLDEFAGLLGEHYERAGELSTAADWYLRAGRRAMEQGAPREARGFFTKALELLPPVDRERRWQALSGRQEAYSVMSEAELEKADLNAMLELARSFDDDRYLAEVSYRRALFGTRIGSGEVAFQAAEETLTAARRSGNEALEIKALAIQAMDGLYKGEKSAVINAIEAVLARARQLGDEGVLADVLFRAAFLYSELIDVDKSYPLMVEQIEVAHRIGNRTVEVIGLGNLGSGYLWLGLYKQARVILEQARQRAEALSARRAMAYALMNLGETYLNTGDLRQARRLGEESLEAIIRSEDARGKAFILNDLGYIYLAQGDIYSASRRFQEGKETALGRGLDHLVYELTAGLAACSVMEGNLEEAHQYVSEVWDYLKEHGATGMANVIKVYRVCAEVFEALDEKEALREVIEAGHKELMELAAHIQAPEWRQSFLENVPDNRAIVEMWERSQNPGGGHAEQDG